MSAHAYTTGELESIAKRLGGAIGGGHKWSCRCPAHDDQTASLSISIGEDGKLLWYCHAHCGQGEVLEGLKRAGVLLNGDARGAEPRRKARGKRRVVARYIYTDAEGQLVFRILRWDPKSFSQERFEDGGWVGGKGAMDGVQRVFYRLTDVIAAEEVVIVEGEKDADNLRAVGFTATTSPQGAKFWRDELAAPLAGKRVAIIPDNDAAGRKHARTIAAAAQRHGAASVKVVELAGLPDKGDVSDWLASGHTADELRTLIAEAPEWAQPTEEEPDVAELAKDNRPLIRIWAGGLHINTRDAARVLGASTHANPFEGIYRRGSLLVRPGRIYNGSELERAGVRRSPGTLTILVASEDYLVFALTKQAQWEKYDKRSDEWAPTNAPMNVAKALAAASDQLGYIPVLSGIIEAPTIRGDGSLLDQPGYDPATRLLFDPGGVEFPPIPKKPTRAQAEAALKTLREPLAEFPFVDDASESVALSKIITGLTRKAMRAAPLHVDTAPKMASGKTLLATIGGYIATGRAPAMMSQAEDPESERKRLLAVLLEGAPLVVIDNVERPLKSDALCSVLTEPLFTDRLLGLSKTATAPTNALFAATGNNVVIAGDMTSRAIVCTLDPECERPEERRFKLNLHEWVPAHRGKLVAAALTIVRAYLVAGEPQKGKLSNFARFEDWSRFVREPLVWLGMADPCLTRKKIEENDPIREKLKGLLTTWAEIFPNAGATVAEAIARAEKTEAVPNEVGTFRPKQSMLPLREAINAIAEERGRINPRRLGSFITSHVGRVEGGRRFIREGTRQHAALWSVSSVSGFQPYAGNCRNGDGEEKDSDNSLGSAGKHSPNSPNSPNEAEPAEFEL
jgi:hypothetical protein